MHDLREALLANLWFPMSDVSDPPNLRRGWTTGTCATAATRAAYQALLTGEFPDPVAVLLPGGTRPAFSLAMQESGDGFARAGIVKDAGDDPDVTHGALIIATVRLGAPGRGIQFRAGDGVGTVTRPGLPLPPGEPAINPVPREMMRTAIAEVAAACGGAGDVVVEISVPGGARIAERTLNGRLGIVGGISILGTSGIVVPYSCAAWIHSIYRGIDVARAMGLQHVAGSTGNTSEQAVQKLHGLHEVALIDMGDFVGGMLKYLRRNPVARISIAGGMGKMTKLGQGMLDLHSKRGEVDRDWLAQLASAADGTAELADSIRAANTAKDAFEIADRAGIRLGGRVAEAAWITAAHVLRDCDIELETVIFDRDGQLLAQTPFRRVC
ncbi:MULTISPECIES: cobalt-precorrin-5B (C(1))-methyltransferase [unclassified Tardiphaga]|uniref:cobalt-precorrin-5B (C(1))-methyltransferase n=1 Tax=unclassified Tardiphaga TaxID=2631404 RepID=UPI003F8DB487